MGGCLIDLVGKGFSIGGGVSPCQKVSEPPSCVWPPTTFLSVALTMLGKLAAYDMNVSH